MLTSPFKKALPLVVALGLAAASPLAAVAGQTAFGINPPVAVNQCSTGVATAASFPFQGLLTESPFSTDLHYRFVNNSSIAAAAVTVEVSSADRTSEIVDRGTFSPGVQIDRDISANALSQGQNVCRVTQVDFRDGTSWHATTAPHVTANN